MLPAIEKVRRKRRKQRETHETRDTIHGEPREVFLLGLFRTSAVRGSCPRSWRVSPWSIALVALAAARKLFVRDAGLRHRFSFRGTATNIHFGRCAVNAAESYFGFGAELEDGRSDMFRSRPRVGVLRRGGRGLCARPSIKKISCDIPCKYFPP